MSFSLLRFFGGSSPPDILARIADAIRSGDLDRLRTFLSRWPDQIRPDKLWFGTWLHHAAKGPSLEVLEYLLSLGLDLNAGDEEGMAPLAYAALDGRYANVRLLIERGSILDVSTSVRNPLFSAISGSVHLNASWPAPAGEAAQIVKLLLESGIDSRIRYDLKAGKGLDAVAFAISMGASELARQIAVWNSVGDLEAADKALAEADRIARRKK